MTDSEEEIEVLWDSTEVNVETKKHKNEERTEHVITKKRQKTREATEQVVDSNEEVEDIKSQDWRTICVENIPKVITTAHLQKLFSRYGKIKDVSLTVHENKDTGYSNIVFKNHDDAIKSLEVHGMKYKGYKLCVKKNEEPGKKEVKHAQPPNEPPNEEPHFQNDYHRVQHAQPSNEPQKEETDFQNDYHEKPAERNSYYRQQSKKCRAYCKLLAGLRNYQEHSGSKRNFTQNSYYERSAERMHFHSQPTKYDNFNQPRRSPRNYYRQS